MSKIHTVQSVHAIKSVNENTERLAMMGEFDWGKYLHDATSGAVGGGLYGAMAGGVMALPGAAFGASGSLLDDAGSALYYQSRSNVDKASWQAGDVQTKLNEISQLIAKANPKIAQQLKIIGIDYKTWIDSEVQRKQGVDVSKNLFRAVSQTSQASPQTTPQVNPQAADSTYDMPPPGTIQPYQYNPAPYMGGVSSDGSPPPVGQTALASKRPKFLRVASDAIDPNADFYAKNNANSARGEELFSLGTMPLQMKAQNLTRDTLGLAKDSFGNLASGLSPAWDKTLFTDGTGAFDPSQIASGLKGNIGSIAGNVGGGLLGMVGSVATNVAMDWADSLKGQQGEINERISDIQKMIPVIDTLSNNDPSAVSAGSKILQYLQKLNALVAGQQQVGQTPTTARSFHKEVNIVREGNSKSTKFIKVAFQEDELQNISVAPKNDSEDYCEECYEPDSEDNKVSYSSDHDKKLCKACFEEMGHTMWRDTFEHMPIDQKVRALSPHF